MRNKMLHKARTPGDEPGGRRQAVYNKSTTADSSIPQAESPRNFQHHKIVWHPLLGAEVYIWYRGRIETRVCTWVSQNERWLRLDGELLPAGCIITNDEYLEIMKAVKELGYD